MISHYIKELAEVDGYCYVYLFSAIYDFKGDIDSLVGLLGPWPLLLDVTRHMYLYIVCDQVPAIYYTNVDRLLVDLTDTVPFVDLVRFALDNSHVRFGGDELKALMMANESAELAQLVSLSGDTVDDLKKKFAAYRLNDFVRGDLQPLQRVLMSKVASESTRRTLKIPYVLAAEEVLILTTNYPDLGDPGKGPECKSIIMLLMDISLDIASRRIVIDKYWTKARL